SCQLRWFCLATSVSTYLGCLVFGCGDEVRPVLGPLEIDNGVVELVDGEVIEEVAGLGVVLGDGAVLVAGDDVLAQVAPPGNGSLALVAYYGQRFLVALFRIDIEVDIEHNDRSHVSHALLRHAQELRPVLVELDTLDGRREFPRL